jgi:hypothetical protein
MSLPIEDYALISDCHSGALLGKNGFVVNWNVLDDRPLELGPAFQVYSFLLLMSKNIGIANATKAENPTTLL